MGIYDVPAAMLIDEMAKDFKTKIKKPEFTEYTKTGAHKERVPNNEDWFYVRMGSILYRTYKDGSTGTGKLRTYYGGRKNRGVRPEKKMKASGKVIRVCLQLLEKEGLLKKDKKGRKVSAKGEKFLNEKSKAVQKIFDENRKNEQEQARQDIEKRAAAKQKVSQETGKEQKPQEIKKEQKLQQKPQAQKGEHDGRGHETKKA